MTDDAHLLTTRDSYNRSAEAYDEKFSSYRPYLDAIHDFLARIPSASRILDIGCGTGIAAEQAVNRGHLVTGIDASESMIRKARQRCPKANFLHMTAEGIRQFAQKFNVAIASFVIVHFKDEETDRLLADIAGILDPSGSYLYLSFMTGKKAGYETTSFNPDGLIYFNYYDPQTIRFKVESLGFALIHERSEPYQEPDGSMTDDVFLVFRRK